MRFHSFQILASIALALAVTGCAQKASFVLVADPAQIGQGAEIALQEGAGTITMAPVPGWPAGLHEAASGDVEHAGQNLQGGYLWSVRVPGKNATLSFVVSGKTYICDSCVSLHLPIQWTRKS